MFDKPKTKEPVVKPEGVRVVQFTPIVTPGAVGNLNLSVYGLGSDELVYFYRSAEKTWYEIP